MRKSIKELAWDVTEQEYRKDKAISYSTLSSYDREGQKALLKLGEKKDSEALRFGSLTDVIITEPEQLNERFLISSIKRPTDTIMDILLSLFEESDSSLFENISEDLLLKVINDKKYYTNWKDETRINKVISEGSEYYNLLILAGDRTIMSSDDYNRAKSCTLTLETHPFTAKYFTEDYFSENEAHYQLKFKVEPDEAPNLNLPTSIRCMFDRVIVNHEKKYIQPIDLKTTGKNESDFQESYETWRYFLQASMYWNILRIKMNNDDYFKEFELLPFKFIVINRWNQTPLVWTDLNSNEISSLIINNKEYKSWYQLLVEVNWFFTEKKYDYTYKEYHNKGEMFLKSKMND